MPLPSMTDLLPWYVMLPRATIDGRPKPVFAALCARDLAVPGLMVFALGSLFEGRNDNRSAICREPFRPSLLPDTRSLSDRWAG
jgi:hypothetical protein